jgi:hypothetical protein
MDIRLKNRIGAWGFAILLLAVGAYLALTYWPASWRRHADTAIQQALATDLKGYDDEKLTAFIAKLDFTGATHEQGLELAAHLKARFDRLPLADKLALILSMRREFAEHPDSPVVNNTRRVMQDFWSGQLREYMAATPEQRRKIIDQRVDEEVALEDLQALQQAALSLLGRRSQDPLLRDISKFPGIIAGAIRDGFASTPPAERAVASQFLMDMRNRREERGLPVVF